MKVAHVVKRIEMIDDDIKQLKKLENQLKKGKRYSTPIMISIEKQINLLLAERIKYLELKIQNPPEFADWEEDEDEQKRTPKNRPEKASRIRTRKKTASNKTSTEEKTTPARAKANKASQNKKTSEEKQQTEDEYDAPDSLMLTQDMIDKKFEEARKRLLEESDDDSTEKKKGIGGAY